MPIVKPKCLCIAAVLGWVHGAWCDAADLNRLFRSMFERGERAKPGPAAPIEPTDSTESAA